MKIDGGCHCGAITFEGEVDPSTVGVCHCTDCQRLSGSPYRAMIPVAADKFRMRGAPTVYVKTAESGRRRAQAFCPVCGSPIYAADPDGASVYSVRLGAINQRRDLPAPARQIWCDSALSWSFALGEAPRAARQT